ncbi:thiamine phosphate synthase [Fusobacterium animalis]|uniref:thiamine phosphate synthase n=1 Tax=Fusobacterium animalis 7_1 TaxID=457405 RepID=A0A140PTE6_9FUSO|nr:MULTISPECIES: thiamine phosphate synthase [Fusobacterium]ASG30424.1 thiamine phosphate synthase [Fusobacterium animalis]EEO43768.1 thiamine-phosphate pyrophosphorylase [Fusobacterium animalis 7_1]EEW94381.1 thiamine-phosphate pyrophosphorylase [Fusobacterium animalis 3_1_33]EHG19440.2 thiamine-phosphate pyrophosphorylase [Fusobacterium polymorphum F0401]ERT39811.1 thiamine-phosphate pyrophosphorylase [Fusobacterium nucleatum CTI-1]
MIENKIKLNIISNRKLCENENLEKQIEKIFSAYQRKIILENFEIVSLTLREKDLNKNKYLKLVEKIYPICQKYRIDLILHQNYDLRLDNKYNIKGLHLSYNTFKSLNKNIREELIRKYKKIGVSIHSVDEAKEVENLGANYVVAGHIFKTDCKKALEPRGLKFIQELSVILTIPIFAIGGINQENSHLVINSGAFGVCMMSSLMKD